MHAADDTDDLGLCRPTANSWRVVDADEEVFLLYTELAGQHSDTNGEFRGLGYLDNHKDTLTIEFNLPRPPASASVVKGKKTRRGKAKVEDDTLEVHIAQDKTALRSRKGDTGSVLWRASTDFAQLVLQQLHAKDPEGFFDPTRMREAHVLELGAGTGLLAVVFSSLVRRYTVTDIEELVPLIIKNLGLNNIHLASSVARSDENSTGVSVEALDWVSLRACSLSARRTQFVYGPVDLLLVVDCIYHPSLLPALVTTIDHLAMPGRTTVLVVVELRAEDVVREFLELWLGASNGEWRIWHAQDVMKGPYAVWVGRKGSSKAV